MWRRTAICLGMWVCAGVWVCVGLVAEAWAQSDSGSAEAVAESVPMRTGDALQEAVKDAQRRWRVTRNTDAETAAHEFLTIYRELQADTEIPPKVRARMTRSVSTKLDGLSRQIARSVALPPGQAPVLGQFNAPGGGMAGGLGAGQDTAQEAAAENGQRLVELIEETIHPEKWESGGGTGTIQYWRTNNSLIIRQTDEMHREVESLLEQLRRAGS